MQTTDVKEPGPSLKHCFSNWFLRRGRFYT